MEQLSTGLVCRWTIQKSSYQDNSMPQGKIGNYARTFSSCGVKACGDIVPTQATGRSYS